VNKASATVDRDLGPVSSWVERWSHLIAPQGTVLDVACGYGRHMKWLAERGHAVTGVDRSTEAIHSAADFGNTLEVDIETDPWPLMNGETVRQFDAVLVTNYLWRALFPVIAQSVAPSGLLIYETFSLGNETVGKPSRPDFLLRPGELLSNFDNMRPVAFEEGFLEYPPRFVQRIVAVLADSGKTCNQVPTRYLL
jgi:SAM-dependent methyltransferase